MHSRTIGYYFTLLSPWAYMGHALFKQIAARHGLTIDYRPVSIGIVFTATGGLPLAQRAPARQLYRFVELQRWREKRGVELVLRPKYFPCDIALADRLVYAIAAAGHDPDAYVIAVYKACWAQDRNCADRAVLAEILAATGYDAALLEMAGRDDMAALYARTTGEAIKAGVFGSPGYVLDGEVFWGQDRLELLADALAGGRAAYRP